MNEKQMKNWKKVRKLGLVGFILCWLCATLSGLIIAHYMFGDEWIKMIPFLIGTLLGGVPIQISFWKRTEKKFMKFIEGPERKRE